jgi:leucyl aminopeptidase
MKINFAEFELPHVGAVVVGVWEEGALTTPARQLDEASGGAITRALAASPRFRGKRNELVPII